MKLSSNRVYDAQKIIKTFQEAKIDVTDFILNISDLADQFTRILKSRVSLADNIDCIVRDLTLTHNVTLSIQNPDTARQVKHIVVTRAYDFDRPVTSFSWQYNKQGDIDLRAQVLDPSVDPNAPTRSRLTIVMYF